MKQIFFCRRFCHCYDWAEGTSSGAWRKYHYHDRGRCCCHIHRVEGEEIRSDASRIANSLKVHSLPTENVSLRMVNCNQTYDWKLDLPGRSIDVLRDSGRVARSMRPPRCSKCRVRLSLLRRLPMELLETYSRSFSNSTNAYPLWNQGIRAAHVMRHMLLEAIYDLNAAR